MRTADLLEGLHGARAMRRTEAVFSERKPEQELCRFFGFREKRERLGCPSKPKGVPNEVTWKLILKEADSPANLASRSARLCAAGRRLSDACFLSTLVSSLPTFSFFNLCWQKVSIIYGGRPQGREFGGGRLCLAFACALKKELPRGVVDACYVLLEHKIHKRGRVSLRSHEVTHWQTLRQMAHSLTHWCTDALTHWRTDAQTHRHTDTQTHSSTPEPQDWLMLLLLLHDK